MEISSNLFSKLKFFPNWWCLKNHDRKQAEVLFQKDDVSNSGPKEPSCTCCQKMGVNASRMSTCTWVDSSRAPWLRSWVSNSKSDSPGCGFPRNSQWGLISCCARVQCASGFLQCTSCSSTSTAATSVSPYVLASCVIFVNVYVLLGGGFKIFYFHPYIGKWSNWTSIFFKWVEATN